MSPLRWRRAQARDIPALADFLASDELRRVGFSGRLLADSGERGVLGLSDRASGIRLPSPLRGAVWLAEASRSLKPLSPEAPDGAIAGALLCHPSRLAFPLFPIDDAGDGDLALLAAPFGSASAIGSSSDLRRYEEALSLSPRVSVDYRLMAFEAKRADAPARLAASAASASSETGLRLRRASVEDLDALMPLQEAYEREEVLTPIHAFNRAACRASLLRSLKRQLCYAAELDGELVAKAGTNARGFAVDQLGGIYTLPEYRGRGVASALVSALLSELLGLGRSVSLFVKPGNFAAYALYRRLGFEDIGDFRADYFEA